MMETSELELMLTLFYFIFFHLRFPHTRSGFPVFLSWFVFLQNLASASSHFLPPTLGFASNLSHTIIRETQEDDIRSVNSDNSDSSSVSITDEELALLGAPWAKEGMLCRKHYNESTGKRAKSKNWMDVFVVIQRGELSMFIFGADGGSGGTMGVGGGNWLVSIIFSLTFFFN